MKKILLIILLALSACTMTMAPSDRAKYVVKHYLDSINKPNKIVLVKLIKIEPKDIDNYYENNKNQSIPIKTDSEKQIYRKILDSANNNISPNGFYCDYRINGVEHTAVIKLDTKLSKVIHFTELNN